MPVLEKKFSVTYVQTALEVHFCDLLKLLWIPGLLCDKPNGLPDPPFALKILARNQTDGKLGRNDPWHSH